MSATTSTSPEFESIDASAGLFSGARQEAFLELSWLDINAMGDFYADGATIDGMIVGSERYLATQEYWAAFGWDEWGQECVYKSETYAECDALFTSALHESAGLEFSVWWQVWLGDDGKITAQSGYASIPGAPEFDEAFDAWLLEEHPEIHAAHYRWYEPDRDPEAVLRAISVVGEFVESSDRYPVDDPPPIAEPVLTAHVEGIGIFNANPDQIELVEWALSRFRQAGLAPPPVTSTMFPPTEACQAGSSGRAYHNGTVGTVDVCTSPAQFGEEELPITGRRAILHELGHLWVIGNTPEVTRSQFMELRGLTAWTGAKWEDNAFEHAAEIMMWALMDEPVIPRIPNRTTTELVNAYTVLTNQHPPAHNS